MSDMYVITATSVHCSNVANVMQLYMYCNSTLYNDKIHNTTSVHCSNVSNVMQLYMYCNNTLYNDKIHKNHRETEHMGNLYLICIVSQHCLKPATTPPPPQPIPTINHYKHISINPELPFCSNIIHYSVLYNYTVCIVHA